MIAIFLAFAILLSPFQDTFLEGSPLGVSAGCPAFFMIFAAFALHLFQPGVISTFRIKRKYFLILTASVACFVATNAGSLLFFNFFAYGENLTLKAIKVFVLFAMPIACAYLFSRYQIPGVRRLITAAFLICALGLILNIWMPDRWSSNKIFHYTINAGMGDGSILDERPRGFSLESSTLGVSLLVLGLMVAGACRSRFGRILSVLCIYIFISLTGSKGAPIVLTLGLALAYFSILLGHNRATSLVSVFVIVVAVAAAALYINRNVIFYFMSPFMNDIDNYTSVATRLSLYLSACIAIFHNPLGFGFTGFVPSVTLNLIEAEDIIKAVIPFPLNFSEVNGYLVQKNSFAIDTKVFLLDNLLVFGVAAALAWMLFNMKLFVKIFRNKHVPDLCLAIVLFLTLSIYVPSINLYVGFIAYGYLIKKHWLKLRNA